MSPHVLLNLLNESSLAFYLFPKEFNTFNNAGARMLDSIYHRTLNLLETGIFGVKMSRFCHPFCNVILDVSR